MQIIKTPLRCKHNQYQRGRIKVSNLLAMLIVIFASIPLISKPATLPLMSFIGVLIIVLIWQILDARKKDVVEQAETVTHPVVRYITTPVEDTDKAELLNAILPIWQNHVTTSKLQTETAVSQLIVSVGSLIPQFDEIGFATHTGNEHTVQHTATIKLLDLCRQELQPVIEHLEQMVQSENELLDGIRGLTESTADLKDMAHNVGIIAAQTNLLAINASIEAARAGEHGKGFAVVASEVRRLSLMSGDTGKTITERVNQISDVVKTALKTAQKVNDRDRAAINQSRQVIKNVLGHVQNLAEAAEIMRGQGAVIRNDVENLLITLHYQDKVSQMLNVLDRDIGKLLQAIGEGQRLPSPSEWMQELKSHYNMQD